MRIKIAKKSNSYIYSTEYTEKELKNLNDWAIYVDAFSHRESDNFRVSTSLLLQIREAALIKEDKMPISVTKLFDQISLWRGQITKVAEARADIPDDEKERFIKYQLALKIQETLTSNKELKDALFSHIFDLSEKIASNPNYTQGEASVPPEDIVAYIIRTTMDLDRTAALSDKVNRAKMSSSIVDWLMNYDGTSRWESYIAPLLKQKARNALKMVYERANGRYDSTNKRAHESLEFENSDGEVSENNKIYQNRMQDPEEALAFKPINLTDWTQNIFKMVRKQVMKMAENKPDNYQQYVQMFKQYSVVMKQAEGIAEDIDDLQIAYHQSQNPEELVNIKALVERFKTSFAKAHEVFPGKVKGFIDELHDVLENHGLIPVDPVETATEAPVGVNQGLQGSPEVKSKPSQDGKVSQSDLADPDANLAWIKENSPELARKLLQIGGKTKVDVPIFGQPDAHGVPRMKYYVKIPRLLHLGIDSIQDLDDLLDETRTLSSQNYEAIFSQLLLQASVYESRYRSVVLPHLKTSTQYKPVFGKYLMDLISNFADKFAAAAMEAAQQSGELDSDSQAIAKIQGAKETILSTLKKIAGQRLGGKKEIGEEDIVNMTQANDIFRGLLGSIDPSLRAAAYEYFKDQIAKRTNRKIEWGGKYGQTALTPEEIQEIAHEVFEKIYLNGKADMSVKSTGKNPYEPAKGLNALYPTIIHKELQSLNTPGVKDDSWMANMDELKENTKKTAFSTKMKLKRFASKQDLTALAAYYDENGNYQFADKIDRLNTKWYAQV
jgi:hypothetical protein